jgi:hypothetical protein
LSGQGSGSASPSGLGSGGTYPAATSSAWPSLFGDASNAIGIVGGLRSGGLGGYGGAALNAGALASRNGLFGGSSGAVNQGLGYGGNALGIYQGLRSGGVTGYTQAGVNAAQLGARAGAFGSTADTAIGRYAPLVGAGLSTYNTVKNWQSGNTGSDALNGAETGAAWGSYFGPWGTAIGALAGGAIGALSSAFGGGERDPETTNWNSLAQAAQSNPGLMQQLSPSMLYQGLAGVMDAKDNSPGHSQPIEQVFGRMGEGNLMDQLTGYLNQQYRAGKITQGEGIANQWNNVINPWLQSKGAGIANQNTASGTPEAPALTADLQGLVQDWETGAINSSSQLGVGGQNIAGLTQYLGMTPQQLAAVQQQAAMQQRMAMQQEIRQRF